MARRIGERAPVDFVSIRATLGWAARCAHPRSNQQETAAGL